MLKPDSISKIMAWRIHNSVKRGEIDNRIRGEVRGSIWVVGRSEPIALKLSGNCLCDLAGRLLKFQNHRAAPEPSESVDLAPAQTGSVGDITASEKIRVFDVSLEEAQRLTSVGDTPPEHMANCLYLEWFSEANGRVVIESANYALDVSTPEWTLSSEEERSQIAANHEAIRDWLERLDEMNAPDDNSAFEPDDEKPMDEFGYEKMMRESDARTDKYMALLEKYEGHPDCEKIVAREMGWTWLEEALEADERGALPPREEMEVPPLIPNPLTEGIDWVRDAEGDIKHPLSKRSFESAVAIWHFCKDRSLLEDDGDADLSEMVFEFQTTGAKLAGALNGLAYDDGVREGGFVVAALKRALNYLHKSMAAAGKVAEKNLLPAERLQAFQSDLFEIREEILALMERFRNTGK